MSAATTTNTAPANTMLPPASGQSAAKGALADDGMVFVRPTEDTTPGSKSISKVFSELERLQDSSPEWYAEFEDSDLMTLPGEDLVRLLDKAPSYLAQGFMAGVLSARLHLAQLTSRSLFTQ